MRDVLSPFTAWKNIFRDPVTIKDPLSERPGSARYRGFHMNDTGICIGCGTCETICQNAAIDMVPVEGIETRGHDSGLRPRIDYGRCCWCALCVDVCMTGSLSMSNEYKWVDADPDNFRFIPGIDNKSWDESDLGYKRPDGHHLALLERVPMNEIEPETRIENFDEIVDGYSIEQARREADRCVECGLCIATCPAHMSIPHYIKAVREGDYETGVKLLYETNPFSHTCGRVCTHKCETVCAVHNEGDPVAIRWLKRHIMDQVPPERVHELVGKTEAPTGRKIAVIGAGPAGLTAAFDLARQGHEVTVYEARKHAGGMPLYGIPEYRLPFDMLQRDVDVIKSAGVDIRCNTRIGSDVSMGELKNDNDAVVLAIGLHLGRSTRIPGSDHKQVRKAVELLRMITDMERFEVPQKAVVIGGGNVAMDIARSLARLQKKMHGKVHMTVTALEDRSRFLADPEEIREADEEGIDILDARGPQEVLPDDKGGIKGLRTWRVLSIFDDKGRFAPSYDESDETVHEADMVIEAIGQMAEVGLLGEDMTEELEWNRGRLAVDPDGRTSASWLWAAGDCVNGPDVVHAVADGHRVAASIKNVFEQQTLARN